MSLAALQRAMVRAVLDPAAAAPDGLRPPAHFAIYRHNAESSLTEALRAIYPAIDRLVGPAFFDQVARRFLRRQPPAEPRLFAYGGGFARFLAADPQLQDLGYLCDVARLEWACNEAFHAAEGAPLEAADLARLAPAALPGVRLALRPSARLIASDFPVDLIHAANQPDAEERGVDLSAGRVRLLVLRPAAAVLVRRLSDAAFAIAGGAAEGASLGDIVAALEPSLFAPALAELIGLGAFSGLETPASD